MRSDNKKTPTQNPQTTSLSTMQRLGSAIRYVRSYFWSDAKLSTPTTRYHNIKSNTDIELGDEKHETSQ